MFCIKVLTKETYVIVTINSLLPCSCNHDYYQFCNILIFIHNTFQTQDARRCGTARDPHPFPEGLQVNWPPGINDLIQVLSLSGSTKSPTEPWRAGLLRDGTSDSTPQSWGRGSTSPGTSRTWESWRRCWRMERSRFFVCFHVHCLNIFIIQGVLEGATLWPINLQEWSQRYLLQPWGDRSRLGAGPVAPLGEGADDGLLREEGEAQGGVQWVLREVPDQEIPTRGPCSCRVTNLLLCHCSHAKS